MKRPTHPVKARIEQPISPANAQTETPRPEQAVSRRVTRAARAVVVLSGLAAACFLAKGWWDQSHASLGCEQGFSPLAENNNSYIQINILAPHPAEQEFSAEFFVFYPSYESPPDTLLLTRGASGGYAPSILETALIPWGGGRASPKPVAFDVPTPGVSLRHFPLDTRTLDFWLRFTPPLRPRVVMIRNLTTDFIPICSTLSSKWDGVDKLGITVTLRRNPFVQVTAVIVGIAALVFGLLLGRIKDREDLARATASYFFSLWSIRGLVTPTGLAFSTLLDFWFMAVAVTVLFVVAWRLTEIRRDTAT
jgi:hypothetical protein